MVLANNARLNTLSYINFVPVVTKEEVLSMADAVDMSVQEYARQTMNVLTGQLIVGTNLVYQVTVQGETIQVHVSGKHLVTGS